MKRRIIAEMTEGCLLEAQKSAEVDGDQIGGRQWSKSDVWRTDEAVTGAGVNYQRCLM